MCSLCNCTDKERESYCNNFAQSLRKLANDYEKLGSKRVSPHSEEAKDIGRTARVVIRDLVDWI